MTPEKKFAAGQRVYVVMRDECADPSEVAGYIFLAQAGSYVIMTPYINDYKTLDETLKYHAEETRQTYYTYLSVHPVADCYASREEAHTAFEAEMEGV